MSNNRIIIRIIVLDIMVSFVLKLPNLSTALIKYDPVLAGTVTEVAGLAIFCN